MALEAAQIEYDIGCEEIIASHGSPGTRMINLANRGPTPRGIRIGNREYDTILFPPFTENLNRATKALLDKVAAGRIVAGASPSYIDGALPAGAKPNSFHWITTNFQQWVNVIVSDLQTAQKESGFAIERTPKDQGKLFHHRRQLEDGDLLFLVNTSAEHPSSGVVFTKAQSAEKWDLHTGEIAPFPIVADPRGSALKFELPPCGSLLLFLSPAAPRIHAGAGNGPRSEPFGPDQREAARTQRAHARLRGRHRRGRHADKSLFLRSQPVCLARQRF